jgi:hypothetical protein
VRELVRARSVFLVRGGIFIFLFNSPFFIQSDFKDNPVLQSSRALESFVKAETYTFALAPINRDSTLVVSLSIRSNAAVKD